MYCMSCGAQLPEQAQFCFACGNKATHQPTGATAAPAARSLSSEATKAREALEELLGMVERAAAAQPYQPYGSELREVAAELRSIIEGFGIETVVPDSLKATTRIMIKNIMMQYVEQMGSADDTGKVVAIFDRLTRTSADLAEVAYKLSQRSQSRPARSYSDATWEQLAGEARIRYLEEAAAYYKAAASASDAETREFRRLRVARIEALLKTGSDTAAVSEFDSQARSSPKSQLFSLLDDRVKELLGNVLVDALDARTLTVEEGEEAARFSMETFSQVRSPAQQRDFLYDLCSKWPSFALAAPTIAGFIRVYELRR